MNTCTKELVLEKPTRQFKKTLIESLQTDSNPSLELVSDEDALRAEKLLGLNLKRQEGFCKSHLQTNHLEDYFKKDSVTRRNVYGREYFCPKTQYSLWSK